MTLLWGGMSSCRSHGMFNPTPGPIGDVAASSRTSDACPLSLTKIPLPLSSPQTSSITIGAPIELSSSDEDKPTAWNTACTRSDIAGLCGAAAAAGLGGAGRRWAARAERAATPKHLNSVGGRMAMVTSELQLRLAHHGDIDDGATSSTRL